MISKPTIPICINLIIYLNKINFAYFFSHLITSLQMDKYDFREAECNYPLSHYPDVIEPPIIGPSIVFGETLAKWTGVDGSVVSRRQSSDD